MFMHTVFIKGEPPRQDPGGASSREGCPKTRRSPAKINMTRRFTMRKRRLAQTSTTALLTCDDKARLGRCGYRLLWLRGGHGGRRAQLEIFESLAREAATGGRDWPQRHGFRRCGADIPAFAPYRAGVLRVAPRPLSSVTGEPSGTPAAGEPVLLGRGVLPAAHVQIRSVRASSGRCPQEGGFQTSSASPPRRRRSECGTAAR